MISMKSLLCLIGSALLVCVLRAPAEAASETGATSAPFWRGITDAASFQRAMDARLSHARETLDHLLAVTGKPTIENTLRPYDDVLLELDAVGSEAGLIQSVHPDEKVRQTAEEVSQKASALATEISLNRGVFDALSHGDVSAADAETKYSVQRTLRDFRLDGGDKDETTRKRIKALRDELVLIGQDFDRH